MWLNNEISISHMMKLLQLLQFYSKIFIKFHYSNYYKFNNNRLSFLARVPWIFDPKRLELYKRLECCIVFSLVFEEKQVLLFREPILQVLIVRSPGMLSLRQCPLYERTRNRILPFVDRERSRFTRTNSAIYREEKCTEGMYWKRPP